MEHQPIGNLKGLEQFYESPDLVNAFDAERKIVFWNRTCEQLFRIKKETAIGCVLEDLLPYVKTDPRRYYLDRAFRGQKIHVLKDKYKFTDGYYEQKLIPLKDENGKV